MTGIAGALCREICNPFQPIKLYKSVVQFGALEQLPAKIGLGRAERRLRLDLHSQLPGVVFKIRRPTCGAPELAMSR